MSSIRFARGWAAAALVALAGLLAGGNALAHEDKTRGEAIVAFADSATLTSEWPRFLAERLQSRHSAAG